MTLKTLIDRVRQYTRDTTGSLFTQEDIIAFINEGIDRTKRYKYFKDMVYFYASGTAYVFLRIASSQKLSFTLSWEKLASENSEKNLYISTQSHQINFHLMI